MPCRRAMRRDIAPCLFDGTTEVSVNLFSLYCFDKIAGGRDNAHDGVSNRGTQKMLHDYFSQARS